MDDTKLRCDACKFELIFKDGYFWYSRRGDTAMSVTFLCDECFEIAIGDEDARRARDQRITEGLLRDE